MSLSTFADGFGSGINTGIALGESFISGQNAKGVRDANEVMAELQGMEPYKAGQTSGAVPTPEGDVATETPVGYSGEAWDSAKQRYMEAMRRVSDPNVLDAMTKRLAELERGKIMQYGNAAISALNAGDLDAAQRNFAGMSFYTNPGETPDIRVQPDGGLLVQGEGGQPVAMAQEDIADMMQRLTSFEDWRQFTFDRKKHADTMDYNASVLAQRTLSDQQRNAAYVSSQERLGAESDARLAAASVQDPLTAQRTQQQIATAQSVEMRARGLYAATLTEAEQKKAADTTAGLQDALAEAMAGPGPAEKYPGGLPSTEDLAYGAPIPVPTERQKRIESLNNQVQESTATVAADRAIERNSMALDPERQVITNILMEGLRAGDPDKTFSDKTLALLALVATGETGNGDGYDPATGSFKMDGMYYEVGEVQQEALNQLYGTAPEAGAPPEAGAVSPGPGAVPPGAGAIPEQPGGVGR